MAAIKDSTSLATEKRWRMDKWDWSYVISRDSRISQQQFFFSFKILSARNSLRQVFSC